MNKASFDSLLISALKKHYWIAITTFISVVGASAVYLAITPPRYRTSAKLIVGEQDISVSNLDQQLVEKNIKTPGKTADPVATQAELVKTKKVLQRALKNFHQNTEVPYRELPEIRNFKKAIDVEIIPATNILRLVYRDSDPQLAAELLNYVAESVVEENIQTKRLQASALRAFLEDKIIEQRAKLQQAEAAESEYRQARGQVDLETQTKSLVNSLTELENEERMLLARLQAKTIEDEFLQQVTGIESFDRASQAVRIGKVEELQELQDRIKELEEEIGNRRPYLTDKAPEMQALLEEQDDLRAAYEQQLAATFAGRGTSSNVAGNVTSNLYDLDLISQYVSGQIENKTLAGRLKTVRTELNNLRTRVAQIPASQKPLSELVRRREKAEASLNLLQSKLEEAKIAEARPTSTTRIVDLASVNTIPVFPKPAAILVISSTAGIFLAIAVVVSLEIVDNRWHDTIKIETTLPLPTLGILPELPPAKADSSYLEKFLDNPALIEPYRALLKKIESSAETTPLANEKGRTIVVSSISEEEKSFTILHLAAVAAMLSRRTLIIDADLRQPRQHQLLDMPAYPGLTEALENPRSFMSVVQPTGIKNLSVLTHGQYHSRPAALVESESMKALLQKVREYYDLVIVDAPPASVSADAATLSQATDGLVLVVRRNLTSQETILNTISQLENSNASIIGIVTDEITEAPNKSRYINSQSELPKTHYLEGKPDDLVRALKNTIGSRKS